MKLKRFTAPDIRQAINKVRDELGPNAVILSNRSTEDGVEIIAAMDYDEDKLDQMETAAAELPVQASSAKRTKNSKTAAPASPIQAQAAAAVQSLADRFAAAKSAPKPVAKGKEPQESQTTVDWLNRLKGSETAVEESIATPTPVPARVERVARAGPPEDKRTLESMWSELQNLRGLLERQLSSIAWGDLAKRYPQRALATRKLLELGLSPVTVKRLMEECREEAQFDQLWRKTLATFASKVPTTREDIVMNGGVIALVGPTGVGKTTTLAKMAARYAIKHGTDSIALLTTDNYRVGAQEQLKTYGRIMDVPVRVVNNANELRRTLKSYVDKKLVLIDTAGMSQRDVRLIEQLQMLSEGSTMIQSYLVLSAAAQIEVLDETIRAYQKAVLDGCIVTKTDETHSLGGVLSVVAHYQLPIAYVSDGQRVPEDLHLEKSIDLIKKGIALMQKNPRKVEEESIELVFGGAMDHEFE